MSFADAEALGKLGAPGFAPEAPEPLDTRRVAELRHEAEDRAALALDVAAMRALGVVYWSRPDIGTIQIGPPPVPKAEPRPKESEEERAKRLLDEADSLRFGASGLRPRMPPPEPR